MWCIIFSVCYKRNSLHLLLPKSSMDQPYLQWCFPHSESSLIYPSTAAERFYFIRDKVAWRRKKLCWWHLPWKPKKGRTILFRCYNSSSLQLLSRELNNQISPIGRHRNHSFLTLSMDWRLEGFVDVAKCKLQRDWINSHIIYRNL